MKSSASPHQNPPLLGLSLLPKANGCYSSLRVHLKERFLQSPLTSCCNNYKLHVSWPLVHQVDPVGRCLFPRQGCSSYSYTQWQNADSRDNCPWPAWTDAAPDKPSDVEIRLVLHPHRW